MENGAIPKENISASSEKDSKNTANQGRLNFKKTDIKEGSWTALEGDSDPWLGIRLSNSEPYTITGIATQGKNGENAWVKSYQLKYLKSAGGNIGYYKEPGDDKNRVKVS